MSNTPALDLMGSNIQIDLAAGVQDARMPQGLTTSEMAEQQRGQVLLDHNALYSRRAVDLLPEIWSIVWSFLAPHDLVRVTHVCSHWRSIALDCAQLWSRVVFDAKGTPWSSCNGGEQCSCIMHPVREHDVSELEAWLSRSKEAVLSVELDLNHCVYDGLSSALCNTLQPHSHRLKSLTFRHSDPMCVGSILRALVALPALTSLHWDSTEPDRRDFCRCNFGVLQLDRVSLPNLSKLVARELCWMDDEPLSVLPNLAVMQCSVMCASELHMILSGFPRLTTLDAELDWIVERDGALPPGADLAHVAPQLRSATFRDVSPACHPALEQLLRRPSLRFASLVYYDPPIEHELPVPAALFAPLVDDVRVRITPSSVGRTARLTLEASDSRGTTRSFTLPRTVVLKPADALHLTLGRMRMSTVRSLTVPWDLRAALLHSTICAPQLESLRLIVAFSPGEDLEDTPTPKFPFLPLLAVLSLSPENGNVSRALPRELVDMYVRALSQHPVRVEVNGIELV